MEAYRKPGRTMLKRWLAALLTAVVAIGLMGVAAPAVASTTTGAVTVMLLDTSGHKLPVAGVTVSLWGAGHSTNTMTSANGRATLSGVPAGDNYEVAVFKTGDQGAQTRLDADKVFDVIPGHHVWVAMTFRLAASISGTIVDTDGNPVVGYLQARGLTHFDRLSAYSDSQGHYTIYGLPSDNYRINFYRAGTSPVLVGAAVWVVAQYGPAAPSRLTGIDATVPSINGA